MFHRYISSKLKQLAESFPAIFVSGPRQSGKTTLAQTCFPDHRYVSLENPEAFEFAHTDPKGFLIQNSPPCILDEIQRAPELLSYLQGLIDQDPHPGHWILTGSQQFLLMNKVSQTLAGRIAIAQLLPLSLLELSGTAPQKPEEALTQKIAMTKPAFSLDDILYKGLYPRVHKDHLDPRDWYSAYYKTYVERDVRDVLRIGDLSAFQKFVRLCAGRTGQLLNFSSLANDAGISAPTARSWISILEASSLIFLLNPHHQNFNKRLIKSPKLFFLDTGLLCHLLGLREQGDWQIHPLKGAIFETFVVSEIFKLFTHAGETPPLYFWRDHTGHEVDLIVDLGVKLLPIEIKAGQTVTSDYFEDLKWWLGLKKNTQSQGILSCAGEQNYQREQFMIHPWWHF